MVTLKFRYNVPDKNSGKVYLAGEQYEFTEERAGEILKVINIDTGLPFAVKVEWPVTEENDGVLVGSAENGEIIDTSIEKVITQEELQNEVNEEQVQAVATAIVEEARESGKTVENVVKEIVEESQERTEGFDFNNLTINELKELAEKKGIKITKTKKDEIVEEITSYFGSRVEPKIKEGTE